MASRKLVLLAALLTTLAASSLAFAAGPRESQYGPANGAPPAGPPPSEPGVPSDGLPFTGLQAAVVALAGLAASAVGLAVRRAGGGGPALGVEPRRAVLEAIFESSRPGSRLAPCPVCTTQYDPRKYAVSLAGVKGAFDSIACAEAARARRGFGRPASPALWV